MPRGRAAVRSRTAAAGLRHAIEKVHRGRVGHGALALRELRAEHAGRPASAVQRAQPARDQLPAAGLRNAGRTRGRGPSSGRSPRSGRAPSTPRAPSPVGTGDPGRAGRTPSRARGAPSGIPQATSPSPAPSGPRRRVPRRTAAPASEERLASGAAVARAPIAGLLRLRAGERRRSDQGTHGELFAHDASSSNESARAVKSRQNA